MTRDVLTVSPDATFKSVVTALLSRRVDAAPVVDDDGRLLGVVSAADLTCHDEERAGLAALLLGGRQRRSAARKARGRTVAELMTAPARTVGPEASVCQALGEMQKARVGRLVVVDDDGQVAGIVTRSDVLRVYLRPDDVLRREVEQAVHADLRGCPARLDVEVADGVVWLRGWVERTSCAWRLAGTARDVPGVVDVEEDLLSDIDDTEIHEMSVRGPFL